MAITRPQSWYDLPLVEPADPRDLIASVVMDDNTAAPITGLYENSQTFLKTTTWGSAPLGYSAPTGATRPYVEAVSTINYRSVYQATDWTTSHGMVVPNTTQYPPSVQKVVFLKAGLDFINVLFLDWTGGVTSTDVQLSMRDNSMTSGNYTDAALGTVPVFAWTNTMGGVGRKLQLTLKEPGRYPMALRIVDNSGNWSIFEMDWVVIR